MQTTGSHQSGPAITINSWCHYKDLCVLHGGFVAGTHWNPTNMSCFSIINLCRWICVQLSGMENTIPTFSFCVTKPHRFHFQTKNNICLKNLLDSSHFFFFRLSRSNSCRRKKTYTSKKLIWRKSCEDDSPKCPPVFTRKLTLGTPKGTTISSWCPFPRDFFVWGQWNVVTCRNTKWLSGWKMWDPKNDEQEL